MKASELMTAPVQSVPPDISVLAAIRLMLGQRISGLPVVDGEGQLLGIVTEGDLLRRGELDTERQRAGWLTFLRGPGRAAADYLRSHARKVADLMTTEVITAEETTTAEELVALMEEHRIKRIPILRAGILMGVVSRADLLRVLAQALAAEESATPASDAEIGERFTAEIAKLTWVPRTSVMADVTDGVVRLHGVLDDERERWALRVLAENIPGVKHVTDEMVTVEPTSGAVIGQPG